jgi:hypothetical protein
LRIHAQLHQTNSEKTLSPSREDTVLSDHVITIAGRSISITSHELLLAAELFVIGLLLCLALFFSRKRTVVLKMSGATDQITIELSRIADALERIARQQRVERANTASPQESQPPPQKETQGIAYSMFGR